MSRIFWDTNLFIYLLEDRGPLAERVGQLRQRMLARSDELLTSALTLGEVLVKPLASGNQELADRYTHLLSAGATVIPFQASTARRYAAIRSDRSIAAPDAIQLACAADAGADLFVTNDERLSKKVVPGIQFLVSLERVPL